MIYLAACLIITVVALSYLIYDLSGKIVKEREAFAEERQILLNRIENPKYQPPVSKHITQADVAKIKELQEEADQFGLIGKIVE